MIEIETTYDVESDGCILKIKIPGKVFGTNRWEKVRSLVKTLEIFLAGYVGLAKRKELSD